MIQVYFKGGKGILKPVDAEGKEIKEGTILTFDYFDKDYPLYFHRYYPDWSDEKIKEFSHRPCFVVKWNEKGYFYAEGIEQELYLHDFRFQYCKVVA